MDDEPKPRTAQLGSTWFVVQCILEVAGFLPIQQKGIPQPFLYVFFGHVAPI